MKRMPLSRLFALPLALTLLLSPAAQALTPDQARELLQDYYIDEVPEDVLDQNTIQAMLEALGDPYTTYFSPEEYGAFTGSMSDTDTVGVGIYSLVTADGPLIQRVYENTPAASASELFASDIRDTNTGILVGGRTFGKGVAQTVLDQRALPDYFPDGDAIKITSYRFYAPSGSTTDTVGLIPHLLVDPDLAPEVATLLSASSPKGSTEGYLRIDFNWRWYVELDTALSEAHRDAFTALLEALPDGVRVLEGTGGPDGWADTTVEELVGRYVLTSYRDRSFTDTAGSPYAAQIDRLATYGILAGTGGGAFQPEGSLTRAQLCALLAQALNCRVPTGESQFTDVSMDDWYGLCVNAVARLGLVEGVGEGRFAPDAPVSHEQFITIMARLSQRLQEMPADAAEATGLLSYSGWARDSVWLLALSQKGLLGNTINLLWEPLEDIDPAAVTTREEAAALTCTLLNYFGILPS